MDKLSERRLHELVFSDVFYQEFHSRLVDPNERDNEGITLLHAAAFSTEDNSKILQLLLVRGAYVNDTTTCGSTPLHFAVARRNRNAVVTLTEAGATVNSEDSYGRTSLHLAITKRWISCESLLNADCDMWIVEWLLSHPRVNLNTVDGAGETPLMLAVREQNSDAVRALLKKGTHPNIPNNDNQTPLHVAMLAQDPSYEIVKSLLTNGAGIYCEDNLRQTPMDVLIRNVCNDETLTFASRCVWLIAFRYQIRDPLRTKLRRIPMLSSYLDECCEELGLMKRVVIHDNFTLYDFAQGCLQVRVDNNWLLYTQLVEILLSGMFSKYFEFILFRLSRADLRSVLVRVGGKRIAKIPEDASSIALYHEIGRCYNENDALKKRALKLKEFLMNLLLYAK